MYPHSVQLQFGFQLNSGEAVLLKGHIHIIQKKKVWLPHLNVILSDEQIKLVRDSPTAQNKRIQLQYQDKNIS